MRLAGGPQGSGEKLDALCVKSHLVLPDASTNQGGTRPSSFLPSHLSAGSLWAELNKEMTQGNRVFRAPAQNLKIEYKQVGLELRDISLLTTTSNKYGF